MSGAKAGTERRIDRLRALTEVSRALTYARSIEQVLDLAVKHAAELVEGHKAVLMLVDEDGLLAVRAAHGIDEQRLAEVHAAFDETLIRKLRDLLGYRSQELFLSVPLVIRGEVIGLLGAVRAGGGVDVPQDDEWLLSALADQASVAIETARLAGAVAREKDARGQAAEAQGRARATLGHELRSPLNAIQSYSDLLLEGALGPLTGRQREAMMRIRMSGEHLLAVIEDVQDMARIYAGTITLTTNAVPAPKIVAEAVQLVEHLAEERNLELRTNAGGVVVRADAHRLRQALVNLLDNAIKYSPEGGTVEVETFTRQKNGLSVAAITVTDDGQGIPSSELDTIFEPYERGAAPREGGLGLGLSISRELVRKMGGDIEVRSPADGGSTFTILLPLAVETEDGVAKQHAALSDMPPPTPS